MSSGSSFERELDEWLGEVLAPGSSIIPSGKYRGWSLAAAVNQDAHFLRWLVNPEQSRRDPAHPEHWLYVEAGNYAARHPQLVEEAR